MRGFIAFWRLHTTLLFSDILARPSDAWLRSMPLCRIKNDLSSTHIDTQSVPAASTAVVCLLAADTLYSWVHVCFCLLVLGYNVLREYHHIYA